MSSRVIILEGPDGSGKTYLANALSQVYGYRIVKTDRPMPGENLFKTYTDALMEALRDHRPVVFDRHYLGESVYGPIMRGIDTLGDQGKALIERIVAARGVRLLICLPDFSQNLANWSGKAEDYLTKVDQLRKIYRAYEQAFCHLDGFAETYNYLRDGENLEWLIEPREALPIFCTGYPKARYLVVGEVTNDLQCRWDLPFHCLGGSSRYLWDRMRSLKVPEEHFMWANALNMATGEPNRFEFLNDPASAVERVIVLGKVARTVLNGKLDPDTLGKIMEVPHPQYWKRFHAREEDVYENLLREALGI